jgi:UDPglucose 6-dehydrogenase
VLAYVGHQVTYMDKDEERVAELEEGRMPNYQPGLEERVNESARRGRLWFSTDLSEFWAGWTSCSWR